ncbi:MAG TPA: hypothetical protein PL074_09870, partial [Thermoflexales bacterium]|nr:hypothetical protein [Thermoflexales bacterium]
MRINTLDARDCKTKSQMAHARLIFCATKSGFSENAILTYCNDEAQQFSGDAHARRKPTRGL